MRFHRIAAAINDLRSECKAGHAHRTGLECGIGLAHPYSHASGRGLPFMPADLPPRDLQVLAAHAPLIVAVVQGRGDPAAARHADDLLAALTGAGHGALANALGQVLRGSRPEADQRGALNPDETLILEAVLRGVDDPSTLPDPAETGDPTAAAPGLARMIHASARGDAQALHALSGMAEQMVRVGGDMGRLGGLMRRLVDGERDADVLAARLGPLGTSLIHAILDELAKLDVH